MSNQKSFTKLTEELLHKQPELAIADSETFLRVFKEAAAEGCYSKVPDNWNILRSRFSVRAKLACKAKKKLPRDIQSLLDKARQSALEAVGSYNDPLSPFRSGTYIIMMHVAWTSLLLAMLCNRGTKPYYRNETTGKYRKRADGDYQYFSLVDCIDKLKSEMPQAVVSNLRFFVGLRNKIEHALMPELDLEIFGECQSMLMNFELTLIKEFGEDYALNESLAFSLQFSRLRMQQQDQAAKLLHSAVKPNVRKYIDKFRSSLSDDILGDMSYSFKVFLVPNVGNHRSKDALAIEWVHYDLNQPEAMGNYLKTVALIKDRHVPVANLETMRAGIVAERVSKAIGKNFTASYDHAKCWRYYNVRPSKGVPRPEQCNSKYCVYDKAHGDYVYTEKWVEKLIQEMSDDNIYKLVTGRKEDHAEEKAIG